MKSMLALGLSTFFALSIAHAEPATPLVPSGDAVASSSISDRLVSSENSQKASDEIRVTYPEISRDILTLYTIDKVVLTSNGTLDLYSGETLWMTLEKLAQATAFTVRASAYEFEAASIEHTMAIDNPDLVSSLDFVLKGCPANQGQQGGQQDGGQQGGGQQTPPNQQQTPGQQQPACEQVRVHLGLAEIVPQ